MNWAQRWLDHKFNRVEYLYTTSSFSDQLSKHYHQNIVFISEKMFAWDFFADLIVTKAKIQWNKPGPAQVGAISKAQK